MDKEYNTKENYFRIILVLNTNQMPCLYQSDLNNFNASEHFSKNRSFNTFSFFLVLFIMTHQLFDYCAPGLYLTNDIA